MKRVPTSDLLFTYGTLRRADVNAAHRLLADSAEIVGTGFVRGRLYQATDFPVLVLDPQGTEVAGEVYRVSAPKSMFARLDQYEGFDARWPPTREVRRAQGVVAVAGGQNQSAWADVYQRPLFDLLPIPHGDYARFLREEAAKGSRPPHRDS